MQVSVIVVSYNVREFLANLLKSLKLALMGIDSEIIVVDNASEDETVAYLRKTYPELTIIENRSNLGFGKANNQAARIAHGDHLLLINPDAVVEENTVKEMLSFMKAFPDAGAAGCRILNADGTLQRACRRSFPTPWVAFTKISGLSSLFPRSKIFGRYNLTYLDEDNVHEVDAISGSFMFIPRRIFEEVGGFDEDYFMYGEDLDLCYKIKQAGYRVYYNPSTSIIHFKGQSTRRSRINRTLEFYRAMRIFVDKRYGKRSPLSGLLKAGIMGVKLTKTVTEWLVRAIPVLADFTISITSIIFGEYLRTGKIFAIPHYAVPYFYIMPALVLLLIGNGLGIYRENRFSLRYSGLTTFLTFLVLSSFTYFFKQFAFSRFIILVASLIMFILIPGWRLLYQTMTSLRAVKHPAFGRRTAIVGSDARAIDLIRKIRGKFSMGYEIIGVISEEHSDFDHILGIRVLGSLGDLPAIIRDWRIEDVIFASSKISYSQILQAVGRSQTSSVNFKLVPDTLDVIIGKTQVDGLSDIPFVNIEYKLNNSFNRTLKRMFDVVFASVGLILLSPATFSGRNSRLHRIYVKLPLILRGEWSVVGRSEYYPVGDSNLFGKFGLTGVVQLNRGHYLSDEEVEKLYIYYAKNQSLALDMEIILKSILQLIGGGSSGV
ncbi:MAG: glycosyltransferase [Candidatus Kryptoniota bacterium]